MADEQHLSGAVHLAQTIHALQRGLTSIPLSDAILNIDTWFDQLQRSGVPELQNVARELGNLQSLLSSGNAGLDGGAIGASLSMLGSQATELAVHADPDAQAELRTLGDLLLQAGASLSPNS
ncbi:hypothetical protein [Hymenobacter sp. GOD-10R]|uniref:hypothetical protein n=1 Tax=Hymenobacter sp. GOD-10R TaxID=3093922 RepID=UPI002D768BC2|nr:hypothetical protein [Hymenobacter sp. GOD-10R]WRQ27618.1 hypothetical protein SD425_21340 [Hymenobacter sp. GOD-10R]